MDYQLNNKEVGDTRYNRKCQGRKEELKRISSEVVDEPGTVLRLYADKSGRLGLIRDVENEGDQLVEHEGSTALVVGKELSVALEGVTTDFQNTDEGQHLILTKNKPESKATGQE